MDIPIQSGRVVYVEPNNNIVGRGNASNFTFNPEDYSILVDLQVDVVDRYAYNGSGGNEIIQYTLEWDAKGTKTSLFKGTNGMLSTRVLDTSFDDISKNLNQEAIGINSIDIRYNSWNYPEITINFTDVRGASLLASADFAHSGVLSERDQRIYDENFVNTFFSTFFRFPYPLYTLTVKGFYGRPVTYSLCVNDFKTKFNPSTGNFDVTVSFIGYMYGLLTDIPMRLLFAAPYSEYVGQNYWNSNVKNETFVYEEGTGMLTFIELNEKLKAINQNLEKMPGIVEIMDEMKSLEDRKTALNAINSAYYDFRSGFEGESVNNKRLMEKDLSLTTGGNESVSRKYLVLFSSASDFAKGCDACNNTGYEVQPASYYGGGYYGAANYHQTEGVPCKVCDGKNQHKRGESEYDNIVVEETIARRNALYKKVSEYNSREGNEGSKIIAIPRISNEDEVSSSLYGTIVYIKAKNDTKLSFIGEGKLDKTSTVFKDVVESDIQTMIEFLSSSDVLETVNSMNKVSMVSVAILRVDEFEHSVNSELAKIDSELEIEANKVEEEQQNTYAKLLSFKVTLKNVISMCLAHLDTFMECMYKCMEEIKGANRLFSDARLDKSESDVQATTEQEDSPNGSPLYLPPFFAFRKVNPKSGELEDEWIGSDPRFSDTSKFREIELIEGFLNGTLKSVELAKSAAEAMLEKESEETTERVIGNDYVTTFVSDYYAKQNPYLNTYSDIEKIVLSFAFRCMLSGVYSMDYPNINSRFDKSDSSRKFDYFKQFAENEVKNFTGDKERFKTFREGLSDVFENLNWDKFEAYITGKVAEGGIVQEEKGHMYFRYMNSPLFEKTGYDDYVLAFGHKSEDASDDSCYVLPLYFDSPDAAIQASTNVYKKYLDGDELSPELNALGISRKYAMPNVEVIGNDSEFRTDRPVIESNYANMYSGTKITDIGWYFKTSENWKEYFSGVVKYEHDHWFPTVVLKSDVREFQVYNAKDVNNNGNIYNGKVDDNGKEIYGYAPVSAATNMRDFFITKETAWYRKIFSSTKNEQVRVEASASNDRYVERTVVPEMVDGSGEVTLVGFPCAEGTLFESEFYLMQNTDISAGHLSEINERLGKNYTQDDIKRLRKAFLFLHSLPTSEAGALSRVVETIIKRTYTPSVTDIPLSSALFIGALYWRELANNAGDEEKVDNFICYSAPGCTEYIPAKFNQFLTYTIARNAKNGENEIIRRPLNPIKKSKSYSTYLEIDNDRMRNDLLDKEERSFASGLDRNLYKTLTDNENSSYRYFGFWEVFRPVKEKFINLFENWANGDFGRIESELSLRDSNGVEFTPEMVLDFKKIIVEQVFQKDGKAKKDYNGSKYNIQKNTEYNDFLKSAFSKTFFRNHQRLGASSGDTSLFSFVRTDTEVMKIVNSLITSGCTVKIPFPRVLMTRDMFSPDWDDERTSIAIDDGMLRTAWETFHDGIVSASKAEDSNDGQEENILQNIVPSSISPAAKLSLYETLKNVHDKWLVATGREKYRFKSVDKTHKGISDCFHYINSFYEDVGNEISLNCEELPKQIDMVIENPNSPNSLYSFMYDIANQARVQLLALPVFNDFSDPLYLREMFSPIPYDELDATKIPTESQYVFLYPEEASKQVGIPNDSKNEENRYKFVDDSFMLVSESGLPNVKDVPNTFSNSAGRKVPVFGVTFAKQNQSFFKSVNVSMDSPKTTEVSVNNTFAIANKFKGGNNQVTALGQDLFPIYSNYSYECSVEMMGCACIMPLMYFQLNNIPMFKGTYIIYNVSHSITPGNMTTSFIGQRLSRYRKKRNEDSMATAPNDSALLSFKSNVEKSYDTLIKNCYTPSGYKLENEYVYDSISSESGVSDKAALRAVEYAESHYTGGFFPGGKLKVYYDPWMAQNNNVSGDGLTVNGQYVSNYVVPGNYEGNSEKINSAAIYLRNSVGMSELEAMETASSCTITGAFGVPSERYKECGAESIEEFLSVSSKSFSAQGKYFAALLKEYNDGQLRNALQNKDWDTFAKLYKGQAGVTSYGVFMPDDPGFKKYIKDLEAGYNEAVNASSDNYDKYVENNPTIVIVPQENDPDARMLDVGKAIRHLKSNAHANSIHRCSEYVKNALKAGGIPYESCNAADCKKERFIMEDCYKIYDSKPGDYGSRGNKMNSQWQRGDLVIIDNFGSHEYGHIAMWTGNQWISDFRQDNCDIYDDGRSAWDSGKFHFYRFKNRINV